MKRIKQVIDQINEHNKSISKGEVFFRDVNEVIKEKFLKGYSEDVWFSHYAPSLSLLVCFAFSHTLRKFGKRFSYLMEYGSHPNRFWTIKWGEGNKGLLDKKGKTTNLDLGSNQHRELQKWKAGPFQVSTGYQEFGWTTDHQGYHQFQQLSNLHSQGQQLLPHPVA